MFIINSWYRNLYINTLYKSFIRKYIKTVNVCANPQLSTSLIKVDVAIATFNNLLKITFLKERLNKMDIEKLG